MSNFSNAYEVAIAALGFMGLSAEEQVLGFGKAKPYQAPSFFVGCDPSCNYAYGIACVFKTFSNELLDGFTDAEDADELQDFIHRLNFFLYNATASDCSEVSVRTSQVWEKLRQDARRALASLDEKLPEIPPVFDIGALVSLDDFIASDEARQLLGAP
jgi:hypothetical protein